MKQLIEQGKKLGVPEVLTSMLEEKLEDTQILDLIMTFKKSFNKWFQKEYVDSLNNIECLDWKYDVLRLLYNSLKIPTIPLGMMNIIRELPTTVIGELYTVQPMDAPSFETKLVQTVEIYDPRLVMKFGNIKETKVLIQRKVSRVPVEEQVRFHMIPVLYSETIKSYTFEEWDAMGGVK
jgi:hypothetical protein